MNSRFGYKKWSQHKKKLHRRRKKYKKGTFIPRIIADTNIWYQLGKDDALFDAIKDKLTPIYNNLWEMSNTGALYKKPDLVRNGIRKVMLCSKKMIIAEPLKYLIKRANRNYQVKIGTYTKQMLIFTQKIANGYYIDEKQKEQFYNYIQQSREPLNQIANNFNMTAFECKNKIKKKNNTTTDDTEVILIPANPEEFKRQLLKVKKAKRTLVYKDGSIKEATWNASDFKESSGLMNNIKSASYWRNRKENGLSQVILKIEESTT